MSDSLHVGMVLPFSGPGGQYGPSAQAVTELAIEDINATGGILGRKLSPVWIDGGRSPAVVAHDVRRMLDGGSLDAISGWHTSAIREALAPLAAGSIPYVYPALYEGGETASRVLCTGETPDLQIIPAIRWLRDHKGAQRWGLVGDDYVWPRKTATVLEQQANELGISIEQQWFVPQEQATTPPRTDAHMRRDETAPSARIAYSHGWAERRAIQPRILQTSSAERHCTLLPTHG